MEAVWVVGVLPPMKFICNSYRLVGTLNHTACLLTQLTANLGFIFVPTGTVTVEAVDADALNFVQVVEPIAFWTIFG